MVSFIFALAAVFINITPSKPGPSSRPDDIDPDDPPQVPTTPGTSTSSAPASGSPDRVQDDIDLFSSQLRNARARTKKALVWDFFKMNPNDPDSTLCNVCRTAGEYIKMKVGRGKTKNCSGNTSNMRRHMKTNHGRIWAEAERVREEKAAKVVEAQQEAARNTFFGSLGKKRKNVIVTPSKPSKFRKASTTSASECDSDVESVTERSSKQNFFGSWINPWHGNVHVAIKKFFVDVTKGIIIDRLPINHVEGYIMKTCLPYWMPKLTAPPSRYIVTKHIIPLLYYSARAVIMKMLNEVAFFSVDTDSWTSPNGHSFVSLVAHLTFPNFNTETVVLEIFPYDESHTAKNLDEQIKIMTESWNIPLHKQHIAVHDNASNITLAMSSYSNYESLGCFIHTNQLIIKDCVWTQPFIKTLVFKTRKFVNHIHKSPLAKTRLEKMQRLEKMKPTMVKKDVLTRWDSTLEMFESMLGMKAAVNRFMDKFCPKNQKRFQLQHWRGMRKIVQLFSKFRAETKLYSKELTKVSEIIPSIHYFLYWFRQIHTTNAIKGVKLALKAATESANERYEAYLKNMNCVAGTFLDPQYRMNAFVVDRNNPALEEHSFENIRDFLIAAMRKYQEQKRKHDRKIEQEDIDRKALEGLATIREEPLDEESNSSSSVHHVDSTLPDHEHKKKVRNNIFKPKLESLNHIKTQKIIKDNDTLKADITNEMIEYIFEMDKETEGVLKPDDNGNVCSFAWWKENAEKLPNLSVLATKFLSAPGASIASERLFSVSGQIISDLRHRLSVENTEMLTFLTVNLPKIEQCGELPVDISKLNYREEKN